MIISFRRLGKFLKRNFLPVTIVVLGIMVTFGVVLGQGVVAQGFGFEKNIDARKSADAESVAGCIQSCQDMRAGWLEINPDSPNYTRQGEKIEAKAQQCLTMNTLAGSPFTETEILASCGLAPRCVPVSEVDGECLDVALGVYESCLNAGGNPEGCRQRMESVLESCGGNSGACGDISLIGELNLPQCCSLEGGPSGDLLCGTEGEWVVGIAAVPTCYIPGS